MNPKSIALASALTLSLATSWYALAATDYQRLKKDMLVMTGIVKSAIKSDPTCKKCSIGIQGKYLTGQGYVFLLNDNSRSHAWFQSDGDASSFSFTFNDGDIEDFHDVPGIADTIIASIAPEAPEVPGGSWQVMTEIIDDATREALRDVRRERRDLEQEIREHEIELIHVEKDEAEKLKKGLKEMKKEVSALDEKQQKIEKKISITREEAKKEREANRQKKQKARNERQNMIQARVLNAFCDYGATLRSLPAKEKITLVFENTNEQPEQDTVMIFSQSNITDCDRDKDNLKSLATRYMF